MFLNSKSWMADYPVFPSASEYGEDRVYSLNLRGTCLYLLSHLLKEKWGTFLT